MPADALSRPSLVTGFPGFIGRRLVAGLLERDDAAPVICLVEPRMLAAAERARTDLGARAVERVELVAGDIAERRLGLGAAEWDRLTGSVARVFHLAAIYDLAVPLAIAQRVNVDGTGNVLELCAACDDLQRLNYVSTAYVAGDRHGVVYEHELALGQGFKNHYESTKFQAEVWVREAMGDVPTTITRPAIVVGDSRTGETQKFDGPYYMLRTISSSLARSMPVLGIGRDDSPFNVVPLDFVVEAILAADAVEGAAGETLHLTDRDPLSSRQLSELLAREYAGVTPRGHLPNRLVDDLLRFAPMRELVGGVPRESIRYLNHSVSFDTRRAEALLAEVGVTPPHFRDYAAPVVAFFKAHEHDEAFAPRK